MTLTSKKNKEKPEAAVLRECLSVLRLMGVFHWRQNTGAFRTDAGNFFRSSMAGVSDILGIMPDGRFLAVECKREKGGVVSDAQKHFLKAIANNGGLAIVTHSADELQGILKDEINKEKKNAD